MQSISHRNHKANADEIPEDRRPAYAKHQLLGKIDGELSLLTLLPSSWNSPHDAERSEQDIGEVETDATVPEEISKTLRPERSSEMRVALVDGVGYAGG